MNQDPTFEVTVYGPDHEVTYHRITSIRVAEGVLLLTSTIDGQPFKAYGVPLLGIHSWEVEEERLVS